MAGCSLVATPPAQDDSEDAFVHRAYTAWHPLPSSDGSRLAMALEPRRVDADSHGVMINGWRGQVAGTPVVKVVAGNGLGDVVTTLPRGFLHADGSGTSLFVWGSDVAEWTPVAPNDQPPLGRTSTATWLDSSTFAVLGTRRFEPSLEWPSALGPKAIVDAPLPGPSDVARDVSIATYDLPDGARRPLHDGRAFVVASCRRTGAITVAYQPESATTKTVVVDVVFDPRSGTTTAARIDIDDLKPTAVLCRAAGRHAAVVGKRPSTGKPRTSLLLREAAALSVASVLDSVVVALASTGTSLVTRHADGSAALIALGTPSVTAPQELTGLRISGPPVLSGEHALFVDGSDAWVVHLDRSTAAVSPLPRADESAKRTASGTGDGAFIVLDTSTAEQLVRAFFVDSNGVSSDVAIAEGYSYPSVAHADANRAYILAEKRVVSSGFGAPIPIDLLTIDARAHSVIATTSTPLCDTGVIRKSNRCLP